MINDINFSIPSTTYFTTGSIKEFSSYVPLRLTSTERSLLTVIESTLRVSEYTDEVDVVSNLYADRYYSSGGTVTGKSQRILNGIRDICKVAIGLCVSGGIDKNKLLRNLNIRDGNDRSIDTRSDKKYIDKNDGTNSYYNNFKHIGNAKGKNSNSFNETVLVDGNFNRMDTVKNEENNIIRYVKSFAQLPIELNAPFLRVLFEIGRRNFILSPLQMRDTYGKLMYVLQDAQSPVISRSLGFSLYKDLDMVRPYMVQMGVEHILDDDRIILSTMCINVKNVEGINIDRHIIDHLVKMKKNALQELLDEYSVNDNNNDSDIELKVKITRFELKRCIQSISDAISAVQMNLIPVERMLTLLESSFSPLNIEKAYSLEIHPDRKYMSTSSRYGYGAFGTSFSSTLSDIDDKKASSGVTLSHNHSTQYTYVWQSLCLWREVQRNMHKLCFCADKDLLSRKNTYQLLNTGQGMNRVQNCPFVEKTMCNLLRKIQNAADAPWVGLSVIHLGDRDVPNALFFIDKYMQIPRFLKPIVDFVDSIYQIDLQTESVIHKDKEEGNYISNYIIEEFGSARGLIMKVLCDYYKHGFDGSGDDGGSCIDGRLTSSWNWTSRITKKRYYYALMLDGFQGFDAKFK